MLFGLKQRSIIAIKGLPFTRKTEFATLIAASLRCPALSLDDFLDVLHPACLQASPSSSTSTPQPQDIAFQIICRIANSHLSTGLFDNVVIDSPLSSRSHLDQLIELASSIQHTQLIIVESKTKNTYLWQTELEEYFESNPHQTREWYKVKNWEDVEKAIKRDYNERSDGYKVSKLVLDPLSDYQHYHLNSPLMLSHQLFAAPPFIEAVKYMINRKEGDGPNLIVYGQWQQSKYTKQGNGLNTKQWYCNIGHSITNYSEEGLVYEANCLACGTRVTGAAYTCNDCSLALHKECAESFDRSNTWGSPFPDLNYRFQYRFPETLACTSCKEAGKGFNDYCESCLFETHLKCRLMPTVIRHDCEEHFLSVSLPNETAYQLVYQCQACGVSGRYNMYLCKICNVAYHYKCLTEVPRRVEHVHGLHRHHMLLKFSCKEAEDYICDECFQRGDPDRRDPKSWYYACEECVYVAHLHRIPPM